MKQKLPALFLYFLAALFLINIIQATFTELIFDEAYYWYYAQNLSWGYFDHPPMVAFLIHLGSLLFNGELGIRFMSCLLGVGTFLLIWALIDDPKKKDFIPHFFILMFSMTLLNAYGFFILPDTPLLFFTALFLWVYKKFLKSPNYLISIVLGLVLAALMYSKYHAFLVIFLVFLSNLKLARSKFAWLAVFVSLICYTPHFLWLYNNDFVSIKYHLFERPNRPYEFMDFTLGFFLNLVAIFGLTFPWIYRSLFRTKAADLFIRALMFVSYGILLFFFASSFQRRVQTQWIIIICIPMAILTYQYMLQNPSTRRWIYRLGLVNIVLLIYLRIGLVFEPLFPVVYETHGNKNWVKKITTQIGDIPVVFENSYRMAPMFAYYSGNPSYSLNNVRYRQNQYTIDDSEEKIRGQKVLYVSRFLKQGDIDFTMPDGTLFYGLYIEPFESFRNLKVVFDESPVSLSDSETTFTIHNPYSINIALSKLQFAVVYLDTYKRTIEIKRIEVHPLNESIQSLQPKSDTKFEFKMPVSNNKDAEFLKIVISENELQWGLNSENTRIK
jgi:hypothetical protein